jgi:hypothetical protein
MTKERKLEEFEDDRKKWNIYFDTELNTPGGESVISVRFRKLENKNPYFSEKDLEKLKRDIKDLGKFRIIKQAKEF